ncbi:hypothetical protein [Streptomyces sp. YGL11-2]|uniref:hypothetical protein n=1 Tax=Streptomyces sp. YGL11-2 TaxID=3414028 RepID=UPI003CF64B6C
MSGASMSPAGGSVERFDPDQFCRGACPQFDTWPQLSGSGKKLLPLSVKKPATSGNAQ